MIYTGPPTRHFNRAHDWGYGPDGDRRVPKRGGTPDLSDVLNDTVRNGTIT